MKQGKRILIVIAIMLICISTLSAAASFYVAAINPNIGTLTSQKGTIQKGLGIQRTVGSNLPFVIVVNKMDKKASDFDKRSLNGANSVFIINGGKFETFWQENETISWNAGTITFPYEDTLNNITKSLQVNVGNAANGFYNLIVVDNGKTSNLAFVTAPSDSKLKLEKDGRTYTLSIPENYRHPIRLEVNGYEISL